jgi:hypothetical protein
MWRVNKIYRLKKTLNGYPSFSNNDLLDAVSKISNECNNWLDQWAFIAPKIVRERQQMMRSLRCIIKTLIGFFIKPRVNNNKEIYIFEGLINKVYMTAFNAASVVIVGSHQEKEYAMIHGYGFCWAFPIQNAIYSSISKGWTYPAIRQLRLWTRILARPNRIIFFLQEDTQPLGTFFVYLGKLLPETISSVCIQHGYFPKFYFPLRLEGALSDVNFVWDKQQADLIGSNKIKTFEIGLPYIAQAKPTGELNVVLVGTGMVDSGSGIYERSIKAYVEINKLLAGEMGVKVFYRPHPNEYSDKKLIAELRKFFTLVESKDKVTQLNGPKSLFIGVESSLLYEAGVAGHLVAHLKLDQSIPAFEFDFEFGEAELENMLEWFLSVKNNINIVNESPVISQASPLERFNLALRAAKLIN